MKNNKLLFPLAMVAVLSSCKKSDTFDSNQEDMVAAAKSTSSEIVSADWVSVSDWLQPNAGEVVGNSAAIRNSSITADIISNGVVLVYMKDSKGIHQLPYTDGNVQWYYTVEGGAVTVSNNIAGKLSAPAEFSYVIIPSSYVSESKDADKIYNLSYSEAIVLPGKK